MERRRQVGLAVPRSLWVVTSWTLCLLVLSVGFYLLLRVLGYFQVLVVPVLVALLLVALVRPAMDLLKRVPVGPRRRLPAGLAALVVLLGSVTVFGSLVGLVGTQIVSGFSSLRVETQAGLEELQRQLARGPLHVTSDQLAQYVDQAVRGLRQNSDQVLSGAAQVTTTAGHVVTGFFLVLFTTFFFLAQGDRIWGWVVGLFPSSTRDQVDLAGRRGWSTLTSFVRATVIVAVADASGITLVALLLDVPLVLPLGILVFLGAFVPIVGAVVSGLVVVLVALVAHGPVVAALMLAGVLAVQQIESHLLQPIVLGRAVRIHPLVVILAIGAGILVAGVVGALFAVPLIAVVKGIVAGDVDPVGSAPPGSTPVGGGVTVGDPAPVPVPGHRPGPEPSAGSGDVAGRQADGGQGRK